MGILDYIRSVPSQVQGLGSSFMPGEDKMNAGGLGGGLAGLARGFSNRLADAQDNPMFHAGLAMFDPNHTVASALTYGGQAANAEKQRQTAAEDRQYMLDQREAEAKRAEAAAASRERFMSMLPPELQSLYEQNPESVTKALTERALPKPTKPSSSRKKFEELVGMGVSDTQAQAIAYGTADGVRIGPNGQLMAGTPFDVGKEAGTRMQTAAPIIGPVVDRLEELFSEDNPLNDRRTAVAAGVSDLPMGLGDVAGRMIGGDDFQEIETLRGQAEALVLPMQSGLAVTAQEAQRFVRAGVPQVGDTPENARRKLTYLRSLDTVVSAAASGTMSQEQAAAEVARLYSSINAEADQRKASQADGAPTVGAVEDGYRFMGGDASDVNNWTPVE